jgi:hypothetical protein
MQQELPPEARAMLAALKILDDVMFRRPRNAKEDRPKEVKADSETPRE